MRGIYKITNTVNNKCYIGKSEMIADRLSYHIESLINGNNKNIHMQNAYNKYGSGTFNIEILEVLDDEDDINEREKYWIKYYNANNREFGYNRTNGGDGGNSYVDCMTEEEKEEHYKKHKEMRSGENNVNYGKHLFTDGVQQKYVSDDEVEKYMEMGWRKGASDSFKEKCRDRSLGENNPFYGKKHSQETLDKIQKTKKENGINFSNTLRYYKDGKYIFIKPDEVLQYEKDGWTHEAPDELKNKISIAKKECFADDEWKSVHFKNLTNHYIYHDMVFYGQNELINYLHENGYPKIDKRIIAKLGNGKSSRKYTELLNEITLIKRGEHDNVC